VLHLFQQQKDEEDKFLLSLVNPQLEVASSSSSSSSSSRNLKGL
jgi:hypothetical protein